MTATRSRPTHRVYQLIERDGQAPIHRSLGAAWSHRDGQGFSLQLDAMPTDGRLHLRPFKKREEA